MGKVDQNKFSKSKGVFHHHRKEINKKTKINLVFDCNARKDYLLGFRKRKQERAEHYKKKIETKLVAEKKRIKEKAKERGKSSSHFILPEVEDLLGLKKSTEEENEEESQVYEVGSKTVTISSLHGIFPKRLESSSEEEEDNEADLDEDRNSGGGGSESDQETKDVNIRRGPLTKSEKASVNKDVVRLLQKSKPFKTMQRMKQKKSKNKKNKKKKMSGNKAKNVKVKNNRRTRQ